MESRKSGLLFMDMRTGKCYTTLLGFLESSPELSLPMLLLSLKTPLLGWVNELLEFGIERNRIQMVEGTWQQRRNQLRYQDKDFFLLNYDVAADLDVLNVRRAMVHGIEDWGSIVFDESYCISVNKPTKVWRRKDLEKQNYPYSISKRTHYFLPEVTGAIPPYQRRVALSGLPAPESPMNVATQFLIIDGHYMGYTDFISYLHDNWEYNKWEHKWEMKHPYHRTRVLEYVYSNAFCVTMEECNELYQGLLHTTWEIPATEFQLQLFSWLDQTGTYQYPDDEEVKLMTGGVRFNFGMSICAGIHPITKEPIKTYKGEYIAEWYKLRKLPAVIVSQSRKALLPLQEFLTSKGIPCAVVHGGVSKDDRERIRRDFQDGKIDMLLGQAEVIMMGYDLSRADYIFQFSTPVKENVRGQVNMRCCKGNKSRPVTIIDMAIKGTKEGGFIENVVNKHQPAVEYISGQKSFLEKNI